MTGRAHRSLRNILWNSAVFALNLAGGILLSPYILRKIGIQGYGIWALVFATVEYLWLSDMGLRSATLKYAAHYRAQEQPDKINEVLNTGLAYFSALSLALLPLVLVFPFFGYRIFSIPPEYQAAFRFVFWLAGGVLVLGLIFNVPRAALEGFQEYALLGRVSMTSTIVRVGGSFAVLALGGQLRALAVVIVIAQFASFGLLSWALRRSFPDFRIGRRWVTRHMWKEMTGYGVHTLVATIATQILQQSPVVLIGAITNTVQVGYYSLPLRLLASSSDLAAQVGMVTGASSADLAARRELDAVARQGIAINRYCLALFLPLALAIWLYGTQLMTLWVGAEIAAHSVPLLMILVAGTTFGIAAQQNSSAVLYGIAAHRAFAWGLLVEAIFLVAGILVILPRYGLAGVAAWATALLILNRGLRTAWLFCRNLNLRLLPFLYEVYALPVALGIPAGLAGYALRHVLPGRTWLEVLAGCAAVGIVYYSLAVWLIVAPAHREVAKNFLPFLRDPAA